MKIIHKSRSVISNLPTEMQEINLCKLNPNFIKVRKFSNLKVNDKLMAPEAQKLIFFKRSYFKCFI